jgi:20S proteasome subunit beta 6
MTASGCWADIVSLAERLRCKDSMFRWEHKQHLRVDGFSSLLSSSLYERRRFPYFSFCLLGGIDANGKFAGRN